MSENNVSVANRPCSRFRRYIRLGQKLRQIGMIADGIPLCVVASMLDLSHCGPM